MEIFGCLVEELKTKKKLRVIIDQTPILFVFDHNEFFAINDKCPHMGASLYQGDIIDGNVVCRVHKAKIDLKTGNIINNPHIMFIKMKAKNAIVYPVTIKEDKLFIKI